MNTKTLTEKVCADEKLNQLNSFEEVTYYRLIACCETKTGKIDGRIKVLLPKLYPLRLKVVTEQKLENALNTLLTLDMIEYIVVDKETKTIRLTGWKSPKSKDISEEQTTAFDEFWAAYPRQEYKQRALKTFLRINPNQNQLKSILKAIEKEKRSRQWNEEHGRYIPHPATWLNGGNWKNEANESSESRKTNQRTAGVVSADEFFGKG